MPNTIKQIEDYISEQIESEICQLVKPKRQNKNSLSRNQIMRWGNNSTYHDGFQGSKIPEVFEQFRKDIEFDSVTLNEYLPGQMIPFHGDDEREGESIYVLSLLSDAVMNFRTSKSAYDFILKRRSLTIISDELRYQWEHSVRANERRISVVFRLNTRSKNEQRITKLQNSSEY